MDHGLEIEQRVTKDLLRIAKEIGPRCWPPTTPITCAPRTAPSRTRCCASTPAPCSPIPTASSSTVTPTTCAGAEMRRLFSEMPQACDNTLLVAEQCDVHFRTVDEGASFMPAFPVPEGETDESWFIKECWRGMDRRFNGDIPEDCRKQAEYEISVITQMGFPGYFLVVADYINWAKGPRHPGRAGAWIGSRLRSVGLRHGHHRAQPAAPRAHLRALPQPERISMPDIDVASTSAA